MKKTDVDFMLTLANLMSKLEQGESCAEQLQEIAKMSDENKDSITHQLMDRIASREELMYVDAVLAIGYLDADYVQDFAQAMSAKQTDISQKQELVRKVLSRSTPYGKTMMEDVFWKNLTMAAINMKDNELLAQFIRKVEQLRDSAEEKCMGTQMEKSVMEIRKEILSLPLNSIAYLEVKEEDGAEMELNRIKLSALDSLFRSYIREFGKPDDSNTAWQEIVEEYTKTYADYIAKIYYQIAEKLGGDMIVPLQAPCWQLGYDSIKKAIYLYKTCPKAA